MEEQPSHIYEYKMQADIYIVGKFTEWKIRLRNKMNEEERRYIDIIRNTERYKAASYEQKLAYEQRLSMKTITDFLISRVSANFFHTGRSVVSDFAESLSNIHLQEPPDRKRRRCEEPSSLIDKIKQMYNQFCLKVDTMLLDYAAVEDTILLKDDKSVESYCFNL